MNIICGDSLNKLKLLPDNSIDACITDPPYGLKMMGQKWDYDGPSVELWQEVLRVLKPSAYLLAFSGSRTYHRLAVAIEDAGFEIRDSIMWIYGSGFPKGRANLKPAHEPICIARKAGKLKHLNIEDCRIPYQTEKDKELSCSERPNYHEYERDHYLTGKKHRSERGCPDGRYPANVILDEEAGRMLDARSGILTSGAKKPHHNRKNGFENPIPANVYGAINPIPQDFPADSGGASRFFINVDALESLEGDEIPFHYCAKAARSERGEGNTHPTVKPLKLMRYLIKLYSNAGDVILDPFLGSGTTALACQSVGRDCVGIEREAQYVAMALKRLGL